MQNIIQGAHFIENGFESHAKFISDASYGIALDNMVFACVDIVLLNEAREMLLGKRIAFPHPDWWIIGGRMLPGENFEESAARLLKRELDLTTPPARFQYLCAYSLVWAKRAQPPQKNGSHNISITMIAKLSDGEKNNVKIKPKEYKSLQWINLDEMINRDFHPALIMLAKNAKVFITNL